MRQLAVFIALLQAAFASAGVLDTEQQKFNRDIRSVQSFIDAATSFLMGKQSHFSQYQKELLKQSSRSSRTLIELDCKLLTLDDPQSGLNGTEHQFQLDACILSELKRRQERIKQFLCPEAYFEGHTPDCEELKKLEKHPPAPPR